MKRKNQRGISLLVGGSALATCIQTGLDFFFVTLTHPHRRVQQGQHLLAHGVFSLVCNRAPLFSFLEGCRCEICRWASLFEPSEHTPPGIADPTAFAFFPPLVFVSLFFPFFFEKKRMCLLMGPRDPIAAQRGGWLVLSVFLVFVSCQGPSLLLGLCQRVATSMCRFGTHCF
nr:hypothetical protein [Pandoravirus aubagnensis]